MNHWRLYGDLDNQGWKFLQCLAATITTNLDLVLSFLLWVTSLPGLFHWFPLMQKLTFTQAFIVGYSLSACDTPVSTPPSFKWSSHFNSNFCIDPRRMSSVGSAFKGNRLHRPVASYRLMCITEKETGVISSSWAVICIWVSCRLMLWCWGSHGSQYFLLPVFSPFIYARFQRWELKMLGSAGNQASCASL